MGFIGSSRETLKGKFPRQFSRFVGMPACQFILACSLLYVWLTRTEGGQGDE
jgi:hypothetical protein